MSRMSLVSGLNKWVNEDLGKHGFMWECVHYEELLLNEGRAVK